VNTRNFGVYFGEFYYLWKDIRLRRDLRINSSISFMPPGWSHTGEHKTATAVKRAAAGMNEKI